MEIIDDDIVLTGESIITKDIKGVSVTKYIVFTASSVSETSELSLTAEVVGWPVEVSIVRCTNDPSDKTYAIRVTFPYFYTQTGESNVRTATIDGTIYTNDPDKFSPVHEEFSIIGCKRL